MIKKALKFISTMIIILVISVFPVFMSPVKGIWDMDKEDHKKVAEQLREESERQDPD